MVIFHHMTHCWDYKNCQRINSNKEAVHTRAFSFFFVYLEFPNYDLGSSEYKSLDS